MAVVPLTKEEVARLQKRLSTLTTQIREHKGTPRQLSSLRSKRLAISRKLHDETVRLRDELLKPSLVLSAIRTTSNLSPEENHALLLAEALFNSSTIEEMEYAHRRVANLTN